MARYRSIAIRSIFLFSVVLFSLICYACVSHVGPTGESKDISNGILKLNFRLQDFVEVWGYPETMKSITKTSDDKTFSAVWNEFGGSAYQGKHIQVLQVWDYKKHGITLFFDDDEEPIGVRS